MLSQSKDIGRNSRLQISIEELKSFQRLMEKKFCFQLNWYNEQSAERRILKTVDKLKLDGIKSLELKIEKGEISFQCFIKEFTVNVTEIFREPKSLRELKVGVLPFFRKNENIEILLVGCSTGEELATICILLKENGLLDRCKIVATDINKEVLERSTQPKMPKCKLSASRIINQAAVIWLGYYR
jgi:chemotaxis protein methyltransferase CheR